MKLITLVSLVSLKFLKVRVLLPILKMASMLFESLPTKLAPAILPEINCKVLVELKPVMVSSPLAYWKVTLSLELSI